MPYLKLLFSLVIAFILSFLASVVQAKEMKLTVIFDYGDDPDFFRLHERLVDGKEVVAESEGGDLRTLDFITEVETECHTYFLVAVTEDIESLPSNGVTWCPEVPLPQYKSRPIRVTGDIILKVKGNVIINPSEEDN